VLRNGPVKGDEPPLPYFDDKEQKILDEIKGAGGDIFRTDLQRRVGGSNTTFVRKIASLKNKGMIEEYKRREHGSGRLKTAYKLTEYASRLFNVESALRMERWFSASQKIELFPELERITRALMGNGINVYEMLGIEPQHVLLETLLATSRSPALKEDEIREALTMCNAFLQNIITGRIHPKPQERVEGYIIFHYVLEKPKEEIQRLLPQCLMDYFTSSDPLEQHKASSKIVELTIQYPHLLPMMIMAAANVARAMKLDIELRDLLRKYKSHKRGEEPHQLTRIQLIISALTIFKKLYDSYGKREEQFPHITT
jgi:DNA-binding HxlR family transcriptional regulator